MDAQKQLMLVAGIVFIAGCLLAMLPMGTPDAPALPESGYQGFAAQYQETSQSGGLLDGIPIIGSVAHLMAQTGVFLGSLSGLLNPTAYLESLGLPTAVAWLLEGIAGLLIGFGLIYLWKGTL